MKLSIYIFAVVIMRLCIRNIVVVIFLNIIVDFFNLKGVFSFDKVKTILYN